MQTVDDVQHFWSPPGPGEKLLGMMKFEDKIVVATNDGVYVIMPYGQSLPDWVVQKINHLRLKD